ncbi:ATP-binding protein [Thauera sp. JM12B12]|uniref:ATP-binding protein n=1 Tax=Thauera sp. JM12B12 TaxID=3142262 RepID=UPI0031F40E23
MPHPIDHLLQQPESKTLKFKRDLSSPRNVLKTLVAQQDIAAAQVFDEQPMPELGPDGLDTTAMARVFGPTRTLDEKSLQTLKLLRAEQGRLVPTRGAVLLFGNTREQHFPDAWIQCGRFRGLDKVDIFDQHEVHAHLPDAVEEIELFLKKHAFKTARFGAMRRENVWSIPLTMLREAIVNALVHSDYAQRGTPIRVAFFDDRIDIESPGLLLPGMTIDDMKSGVSRIRNPVIARVFRELGLIEQWGSGIRRIFDEATRQGLPAPVIEEIATGVRLRIRLAQLHAPELPPSDTRQESDDDRANLSRLESRLESKLAAKIVLQLGTQPSGKAELARALGHTTVSGELHKQIRRLLDLSLIEMTIPDKPQSRLQRYRLTQTGRQLFDPIEGKTT